MPDEILNILPMLGLAILSIFAFFFPVQRLLIRNRRKRLLSEYYSKQVIDPATDFEKIIIAFNFPAATMDTSKSIQEIQHLFTSHTAQFEIFLGIETVSACLKNYFFLAGNFKGSKTIGSSYRRPPLFKNDYYDPVYEQLFIANILFRKNDDESLTLLLQDMPDNKEHDFFIKDFSTRLKELLR